MRISDWSSDVCSSDLWNRQQQRWIIRAAREVGLNVAAHLPYKMGRFDLSTIADGATTSEHDITYDTGLFEDAKQFLVSAGVSVDYAPLGGRAGYPSLYWSALKDRSEEHTSELQSLMRISYAVFCLKKKK